jgi:hypothetical protein
VRWRTDFGGRHGGSLAGAVPPRRCKRCGGAHWHSAEEAAKEGGQPVGEVPGARGPRGGASQARDGRSDPSTRRASLAAKSMMTRGDLWRRRRAGEWWPARREDATAQRLTQPAARATAASIPASVRTRAFYTGQNCS